MDNFYGANVKFTTAETEKPANVGEFISSIRSKP